MSRPGINRQQARFIRRRRRFSIKCRKMARHRRMAETTFGIVMAQRSCAYALGMHQPATSCAVNQYGIFAHVATSGN